MLVNYVVVFQHYTMRSIGNHRMGKHPGELLSLSGLYLYIVYVCVSFETIMLLWLPHTPTHTHPLVYQYQGDVRSFIMDGLYRVWVLLVGDLWGVLMRIYLLSTLLTCKIYVTVWLSCYIVKYMSDLAWVIYYTCTC